MAFLMLVTLFSFICIGATTDNDACGRTLVYTSQASDEDFTIQQLLMKGFQAEKMNTYSIRKGGFRSDIALQQCIAVRYSIDCGENTTAICNRSNCNSQVGDLAESDTDEYIFLWTTFNGSSTTGNTLLKLSVFDLRVFGFELCDVYIDPVNINITLDSDEPIPQSCYDLNTALIEFTTLLPDLSDGDDSFTATGYAVRWCNGGDIKKQSYHDTILISGFLVATSKLSIIIFCYEIFHLLLKYSIHRKTHDWYHAYWAAQLVIIVGIGALIRFARYNQKNSAALHVFYISLGVDLFLSFIAIIVMFILESNNKKPNKKYEDNVPDDIKDEPDKLPESPISEKDRTRAEEYESVTTNTEKGIKSSPDDASITATDGASSTPSGGTSSTPTDGQTSTKAKRNSQSPSSIKGYRDEDESYLVPPPLSLVCPLIYQLCKFTYQKIRKCSCRKHNNSPLEEEPIIPSQPKTLQSNENWCTRITKVLANGLSLFVFMGFASYLTQAIPAISISYYLSPTASLIRLGFFEIVVIIFIMEFAYLLFLLEKWIWLAYVHYNKKIPTEIQEETEISENKEEEKDKQNKYIGQYLVIQNGKEPDLYLIPLIKKDKWWCSLSCKCFHWLLVVTFFQIIAFTFVMYVSWSLLQFLMTVIIDQTSDPNDQFRDILAILPTVALNGWLLFKQGNIMHTLKDVVSKANKSTIEHNSLGEHRSSLHSMSHNYGSINH